MIPRALWLLIGLQIKAWLRRTFRGLNRPKNVAILLVGAGACSLWVYLLLRPIGGGGPRDTVHLRLFAPSSMALLTLMTAFASLRTRGIYFKPAEIDFLFPAPISRRALLAYKMAAQAVGIALSSCVIGILFGRHVPHRGFAMCGVALFFVFLTIFGHALSLLASTTSERLFARFTSRGKAIFLVVIAALVGALIFAVVKRPHQFQASYRLLEQPPGSWLLAPFRLFSNTVMATAFYPDFLQSAVASVALCSAAFMAVALLDVDYREASVRASRLIQEKLQRGQRGTPAFVAAAPSSLRSLPGPVYLFGLGPLAWRQAVALVRNLKAFVLPLFATLLLVLSILMTLPASMPMPLFEQGLTALVLITIFLTAWLRFDFRSDLDQMEALRSLPVPGWKIAGAQMITPVLSLSIVQLIVLVAAAAAEADTPDLRWVLAIAMALPLVDMLLIAVENLAFLLFPSRPTPGQPTDIQNLGRAVVIFLLKTIAFLATLLLAAASGRIAQLLTGSDLAGCAAAGIALLFADLVAIGLVGEAFTRFDITRER
ncbi:MAG: putative ABC exporter domain-containing protein [Planctomycetota bacterium]